jgi:hypothetical protein
MAASRYVFQEAQQAAIKPYQRKLENVFILGCSELVCR